MRGPTVVFALAFVISAVAFMSSLAVPAQVAIGLGVLIIFSVFASRDAREAGSGERLDACYFLGFLQTLAFLAVSLWHSAQAPDDFLATFLKQLALGLGFSICGLFLRQVLVLSVTPAKLAEPLDAAQTGHDVQPVVAGRSVVTDSDPASTAARGVYEEQANRAVERIAEMLRQLGDATADATGTMTRAGSDMSSALSELCDRLKESVNLVTSAVTDERQKLTDVLTATGMASRETQEMVTTHAKQQLADWAAQVEENQARFVALLSRTEAESRAALEALSATTGATVEISNAIVRDVKALPNPAERIRTLWSALGDAERKLEGSVTELNRSIDEFGKVVKAAGGASTGMRQALDDEAKQIRRIVDELYKLLESRIVAAGRR